MYRRFHTLLFVLATFLLMAVAAACVEPLTPDEPKLDPKAVTLPIRIYLPATGIPATKAGDEKGGEKSGTDDPVKAAAAECALHQLQVWAFIHRSGDEGEYDKEGALAYMYVPVSGISDGSRTVDVDLRLPGYVMDTLPRIDFYVLGNAAALGYNMIDPGWQKYKRGDIKAKVFGDGDGSGFGGNLIKTVPEKGLPMAGYFDNSGKGYDISFLKQGFTTAQLDYIKRHNGDVYDPDDAMFIALDFTDEQKAYLNSHCIKSGRWDYAALYAAELTPSLTLSRAVNKVNFVFSKIIGFADETEITRIEITSIPEQNYVFPRSANAVTVPDKVAYPAISYPAAGEAALLGNADICEVDDPLRLRKDSSIPSYNSEGGQSKAPGDMTAEEYEQFLNNEISVLHHATRRTLYLRESDKPLRGTIYYKRGEEEQTAVFNLTSMASSFPRNTTWTVYAYFAAYGLHVHVNVNAWNGSGNSGQHLKK